MGVSTKLVTLGVSLVGLSAAMVINLSSGVTSFEGRETTPYRDIGGVWTACDGDTHNIDPTHKYTQQECVERLFSQLDAHNNGLIKCMPGLAQAPEHVHAGILDLGYNNGVGAVCRSSIAAKVQAKNYAAACAVIPSFYKAAGKDCHIRSNKCYGIINRREWELALCNGELTPEQIAKGYAGFVESRK